MRRLGGGSPAWPRSGSSRTRLPRSTKPKTSAELLLNERMAQVLLRDNRPVEAEKAFRECLKDDPKNPEVLDGLGVALIMQGRYKDALPSFDKAVALAPENGAFRNNRGVALMELGQYKAAQEDFEVAARLAEPGRPDLRDRSISAGCTSARETSRRPRRSSAPPSRGTPSPSRRSRAGRGPRVGGRTSRARRRTTWPP